MAADRVELPPGQEFFKLNEVCKLANVQPYMLRFWSTEFDQLEASKTGTGQRQYSRTQVETILEVRRLLFDEGLTIAGTRKKINALKKGGKKAPKKQPVKKVEEKAGKAEKKAEEAVDTKKEKASAKKKKEPAPPRAAAEVDKATLKRVQPLLATLKDVRGEVAKILNELKTE